MYFKSAYCYFFFPDVRKFEHIHTQSGQRECVERRQQDEARIATQNVRMLVGQYSISALKSTASVVEKSCQIQETEEKL